MNEQQMTATRYNVLALIGWGAVVLALVRTLLDYSTRELSLVEVIWLMIRLVAAGIVIWLAGPLKTVMTINKARLTVSSATDLSPDRVLH